MPVRQRRLRARHRERYVVWVLLALSVLVFAGIGAGVAVRGALTAVASDLPQLDVSAQRPLLQNTYIYDGSKKPRLLAVLHGDESRVIVATDDISPLIKQAVVAVEDRRFYEHEGVDYQAIARALFADVLAGDTLQGGSTITQQFIKNTYLPEEDRTVQSMSRKVREAVLAYQLEKEWPKDKILTNYLNTIYFGQGAYGVEVAAQTFFGRSAKHVSLAQAALLAAVIKNPSLENPFTNPETARERRGLVLDRMADQGMVTRQQARRAAAAKLPRRPHGIAKSHLAPYFVEYVIAQLVRQFGPAEAFGGGLRVYTTLDRDLQADANYASHAILGQKSDPAVAIAAVEPRTGEVKALVGGRDFERQQFNVAVQGHRQPGSAFKPFALVAAIKNHLSPQTVFYSEPKVIDMGAGAKPWVVSTYSHTYQGPITLAEATVQSDNTVYADLAMMIGPEKIAATARSLGITSSVGSNPAIALGGLTQGVSPLEMTGAYATLAASGERVTGSVSATGEPGPITIRKVTKADGEVVFRNNPVKQQVLRAWEARLTTSILEQVVTRGTGTAAQIGRPCAGKTGTTTNYADAWFAGYTPDLAATVWVGYPGGSRPLYVRGIKVAGGTFPAQIWRLFMTRALAGTPVRPFPDFQAPKAKAVVICARTGDRATQWCPVRLKAYYFGGLGPRDECRRHGPEEVRVPDMIGLTLDEANAQLQALQLLIDVQIVPGDDADAGRVVGQRPSGGATAFQGDTVTVEIGGGAQHVLPSVVGLFREEAAARLGSLGFPVTYRFTGADSGALGTVLSQSPPGGTAHSGTVELEIEGADARYAIPDVTGLTVADARVALSAGGFGAVVVGNADDAGVVSRQRPRAGDSLRIGSLVTLTAE